MKFLTHSNCKKIAILGAGITGLSLAWFLSKQGIDVTVFEKESRPGGWIRTANHQNNLFEWGPRSLRAHDAEATLSLIDELGLSGDILYSSPESKIRYTLQEGKLKKLQMSYKLLPAFACDLFVKRSEKSDESVHEFFARRFSKDVADQFADPLIKGIYAGDSKELSMRACFPKLWEMEQDSRSLILAGVKGLFQKKGLKGILTLKNGMESLVLKLANHLKGDVLLNTEVQALKFSENSVEIAGKSFDHVISTLPAYGLSALLPKSALKDLLLTIPFATLGVVHLGYTDSVNLFKGFGYLVPSNEKEAILGTVFDSSAFPEQNQVLKTRLTVMIGGNHSELELKRLANEAVAKHLGISEKPIVIESFTAKRAIPQYPVGFSQILEQIQEANKEFPRLSLLGTSFYGVSINQCIASAKQFSFQKS